MEYNKKIKICGGRTCGYKYFCDSSHPLVMPNGTVYVHRHIASIKVGHWLTNDEHVHHIDGNRENNDPNNLMVITKYEHARIEQEILGNVREYFYCSQCGKELWGEDKTGLCEECYRISSRLFNPPREELEKLVWEIPTVEIAKIYEVSDSAVGKRCKLLNIPKPPRGYWQKVRYGKI